MKLIIIALIVCLSVTLSKAQSDDEWEQWKKSNNKVNSNVRSLNIKSEDDIRRSVFNDNLKKIKDFNSKSSSFKMGLNEFSDLSEEELNSRFNVKIDQKKVKTNLMKANISQMSKTRLAPPESVNWVDSGYDAPVQNQGSCGSCYTFSAVF